MEQVRYYCGTCGKQTNEIYSDGGGLALVHGFIQCRACYVKSGHPECPNCKGLTSPQWGYCAHCGHALATPDAAGDTRVGNSCVGKAEEGE